MKTTSPELTLCVFSGDVQWGVVRPHETATNVERRTSRQEERTGGHDAQGARTQTELTEPRHTEWCHLVLQQVRSVWVGFVLLSYHCICFLCDNLLLLQSLSSQILCACTRRFTYLLTCSPLADVIISHLLKLLMYSTAWPVFFLSSVWFSLTKTKMKKMMKTKTKRKWDNRKRLKTNVKKIKNENKNDKMLKRVDKSW